MAPPDRTILITGGTSGLGYQAAVNLARRYPNAILILASRKDNNSSSATIKESTGNRNIRFLSLDLSDQRSIRVFVASLPKENLPPISILLLNAGLQFPDGIRYNNDGIEATFAVNHLGNALLFHLLVPLLADEARIVITGSATHDPAQKTGVPDANYTSAEELAHPKGDALKNQGIQRYATSKLCNMSWMYALHRRVSHLAKKWTVVGFDPGMMPGTGLAREGGPVFKFVWHSILPRMVPLIRRIVPFSVWTVQESGENLAWVASEQSTTGVLYDGRKEIDPSDATSDEEKQEDLWEWTVKTLAISEAEMKEFQLD
ncbi:hypothetical protein PFICI_09849 [Pestalotiopsis fici W106-1]|uniref:Uncharacterized protein n=1 Tax=Pestalotiopsis fici (strain W106-1 / CGMCC3.15140) TaxID=1229662 RepID=W3WXF2_PESFW|nr:uncharacterized protein PFICI_09849 [Pestalotiopsis fici W106-1]ETS77787.1 hypothetical protein PFICI_09849 [Pestalotiopsis fici W106-1]